MDLQEDLSRKNLTLNKDSFRRIRSNSNIKNCGIFRKMLWRYFEVTVDIWYLQELCIGKARNCDTAQTRTACVWVRKISEHLAPGLVEVKQKRLIKKKIRFSWSRQRKKSKEAYLAFYEVKFWHSPILHYAFSSWIEKTMTNTIHCY